jgi:Uma2 family endonuclease
MDSEMRFTSADLELMPDDGKRYEIIGGELYVSKPTQYPHQRTLSNVVFALVDWSDNTKLGVAIHGLRVIFADDDDVIPDVSWTNWERLHSILGDDGYYHAAPDLVVEVLTPGERHERRDCEIKLDLYARRGVLEYWVVDWVRRRVTVFRRKDTRLRKSARLQAADSLTSPLLPEFSVSVNDLFRSSVNLEMFVDEAAYGIFRRNVQEGWD